MMRKVLTDAQRALMEPHCLGRQSDPGWTGVFFSKRCCGSPEPGRHGETSIIPVKAAVANAIHNAIGVRMTDLPMSPPNVLKAHGSRAYHRGIWC